MDAEFVKALAASVSVVAAEHQEAQAAREEKRAAESELLARVVALVKPALRALSTRPVISSATSWHGGNTHTDTDTERADWAGVRLAGSNGPDEDHSSDTRGSYEGSDLFLLPDGSWRELAYEGHWSRWQGADSSWEASVRDLDVSEVVAEYDVEKLVAALVVALDKAKGSRAGSTKSARGRVEKFRSLLVLLK